MASIRNYSVALFSLLIIFGVSASTFTQTAPRKAVYVSYGEAQPVLNALRDILPSTLKGKSVDELGVLWPNWIRTRDAEIRARLALGDEDSLVNLLLFGTSYTRQRRVRPEEIAEIAKSNNSQSSSLESEISALWQVLQTRADDLIRGLDVPGNNERLLFGRR